jgi:arginine exporter protein ArgO
MLGSSDASIPFLNPDAYLNHISPSEGAAIEFKNDISLFILGVSSYVISWFDPISIR